jgi:regulator of RNase E activity RraA
MIIAAATLDILRLTTVATIATVLRQNGLQSVWMSGPRPITAGQPRIAGPAFTLRFTPAREDITTPQSLVGPHSLRAVLETMPAGCVVVVDAMGCVEAGVVGDIISARMQLRGVAGLVTDGAIRDWAGMKRLQWPVWVNGSAAPASPAKFHFADTEVPVGCGGVTVLPGDIVVADDDGAVVVPYSLAEVVASAARYKEHFEDWVFDRVREGELLEGLYPPNEKTKARFAAEVSQ